MKVEDRLREILKPKYCIYKEMGCDICSASCGIEEAISQIKSLVLQSLGEKKNLDKIVKEAKKQGASNLQVIQELAKPEGYNQKISELKKIWGVEG